MNKQELKNALAALGVPFAENATKSELKVLLEANGGQPEAVEEAKTQPELAAEVVDGSKDEKQAEAQPEATQKDVVATVKFIGNCSRNGKDFAKDSVVTVEAGEAAVFVAIGVAVSV